MNKLRCYYAHPMSLYNTPQEERDIELLESLGFDVVNPNQPCYAHNKMDYYLMLAKSCDLVAFRALPDGSITSGVAAEIDELRFVIELPSGVKRRTLTVEQTLETLCELGQR